MGIEGVKFTAMNIYFECVFEWDNLLIASKNEQHQCSWGIMYDDNSRFLCISSLLGISSASVTYSSSSFSVVSGFTCSKGSRPILYKTDSLLKYRDI